MGAPLDDDKRAAIVDDIRTGDLSCRAIARKHGVSPATVSGLAKTARVSGAFERSQTKNATRARVFDAKAARAELIEKLYGDAERFRQRVWSEYTQIVTSNTGPELITTLMPPLRDQQAGMTAMAIALDKAVALEKVDDDQGAQAGRTMVNDLFGALQLAYHQIVAEEQAPGDAPTQVAPAAGGSNEPAASVGATGG